MNKRILCLIFVLSLAGCSAEQMCGPAISWMCTDAENVCYQTHDPQACNLAHAQETGAGLMFAQSLNSMRPQPGTAANPIYVKQTPY